MVSSSLCAAGRSWPAAGAFRRVAPGGACEIEGVPGFNLLEAPGRRDYSPLMTRPVSITRSLTQVEARASSTRPTMRYWRRDGESAISPSEPTAVMELELAEASTAS